MRALRRVLAVPVVLVGWIAVLVGDGFYIVAATVGLIAETIRGPP